MVEKLIKHLFIYPIKGLGGIAVDEIQVFEEGLEYDRRWMLVDNEGVFLSQRSDTKLALIKTALTDEGIKVTYGDESIMIPHTLNSKNYQDVKVWDHCIQAAELGNEYNEWFSDILNRPTKLVKHTSVTRRIKSFTKAPFEAPVSFADGYPILILGDASLNFLNEKLEERLDYDRFRPNIVVSTNTPHEEDYWEDIMVNQVKLKIIKPCARCVVPTIDQDSGVKGREPLFSLSKYRKVGNAIHFGANAIVTKCGLINIDNKLTQELA